MTDRSSWGVPTPPAATTSRAAAKSAANRRLKPTCSGTRARSAAATAASASGSVSAIGFSQNTALPAAAQATTRAACVRAGVAITTAETRGSSTSSCGSVYASPDSCSVRRWAAPGAGSATATSAAPGTRECRVSAWKDPMRPAPMSPTPTSSATLPPGVEAL